MAGFNFNEVKTLDFGSVIADVANDDVTKEDLRVGFDKMEFRPATRVGDGVALYGEDGEGREHEFDFTDWGFTQMMARLGIPGTYWSKCPADLQIENGNYWLRHALDRERQLTDRTGDVLLRCRNKDGQRKRVRGFLSDRYGIFDNSDFVRTMMEACKASGVNAVLSPYKAMTLNEDALRLRLIFPDLQFEARPNDWMAVGMDFSNSEVGKASISLDAAFLRACCKNGMVGMTDYFTNYMRKHMGVKAEDLIPMLVNVILNMFERGREYGDLISAAGRKEIRDPEKRILALVKNGGFGKEMQGRVIDAWGQDEIAPNDATVFGLMNAVTRVARDEENLDRRISLEGFASRILTDLVVAA